MYRKMTVAELSNETDVIPWEKYLGSVLNKSIDANEEVVVYAMDYFLDLAGLLNRTEDRYYTFKLDDHIII